MGDRFGREGAAQLRAVMQARDLGVDVTPVWNKSNREHGIIGTTPADTRRAAADAVKATGWGAPYFVDADHINLKTVDGFMAASDFFTLDVADFIGQAPAEADLKAFVEAHRRFVGRLVIPGVPQPAEVTERTLADIGRKYLVAVREAASTYRRIAGVKGAATFVTEVSMDESADPQTPVELFFILAALAAEGVPVRTIAPKFTGRFNKGVDYVGDVGRFEREFEDDLAVIAHAVVTFALPADLKLSVHSGSDKFSLYRPIGRLLKRHTAGVHLKTAGTTWLEEAAGLALAGGKALALAKEVYAGALARFDEMCKPYASVIDIDRARLPTPAAVETWSGEAFAAALRHDPANPAFNPHLRQLIHVGYKVAAEKGGVYLAQVEANHEIIGRLVTQNLFEKHIRPLFLGA
jgi:hypothetical protein